MRIILIFFIFTSLLAQTFSKGIVFAQFLLNQNYIAQNLCENKDKPELFCNGHCHLKKELKKEEEKQQTTFQNQQQDVVLFFQPILYPQEALLFPLIKPAFSYYNDPKIYNISAEIFHPPTI